MEDEKIIGILTEFMGVLNETLSDADEIEPKASGAALGEKAKPEQEGPSAPPPAPAPGNLGWRKSLSLKFQTYGDAMCKRADRWTQALAQDYANPFKAPSIIKYARLASTILGGAIGGFMLSDYAGLPPFSKGDMAIKTIGIIAGGATGYLAEWGLDAAACKAAKPLATGYGKCGATLKRFGKWLEPSPQPQP